MGFERIGFGNGKEFGELVRGGYEKGRGKEGERSGGCCCGGGHCLCLCFLSVSESRRRRRRECVLSTLVLTSIILPILCWVLIICVLHTYMGYWTKSSFGERKIRGGKNSTRQIGRAHV